MKVSYKEFKLYLEGQKVKFNSVQLVEAGYSPPSCVIVLPADSKIMELLPGTIANLFLVEKGKSLLIFEGELLTKSFSKNGVSRTASLTFSALSNTFNRVFKTPVATASPTTFHSANSVVSDSSKENDTALKYGSEELQAAAMKIFNLGVTIKKFVTSLESYENNESSEVLQEAVKTLFEDFTKTSNWYDYISKALKFESRILAFPNKRILFTMTKGVSNILLTNKVAPLGNLATMTQVLYAVLGYFGHALVHLPCPYAGIDKKKSWIIMPSSSYLCPIRNNIFFGSSVQSANYSSNSLAEPTRLALHGSAMEVILSNGGGSFRPTYFAPKIDYIDKENSQIDYSRDEQYIGPIPSSSRLQGVAEAWANINEEKAREAGVPPSQEDIEKNKQLADSEGTGFILGEANANVYMKRITQKKFWDEKYKSRQFTITAPYSPNRAAGFSGIFIDDVLPNVVGMVSSISTQISADGAAVSNITFTRPITLWDWNPDGEGLDDMEIIPELDAWFDPNIYSIDNIGTKVYNIINSISGNRDLSSLNSFENLETYKDLKNSVGTNNVGVILGDKNNPKYLTVKIATLAKALQIKHAALTEAEKKTFEEAIIKKSFLEEEKYWEMLFEGFSKKDENLESVPANYNENEIYRDISNEEDYISIRREEHSSYKPFIKNRLDAVRRII